MASTRAMAAASADYNETRDAMHAAMRAEDGEGARSLSIKLYQISYWLESAMLGHSDRDCEWMSGYAPVSRRMRSATTQLREVA